MSKSNEKPTAVSMKKQIINLLIVAAITIAVFSIILCNNKDFSFHTFFTFVCSLNPIYLALAFVCMFLFIYFEGLSLKIILKKIGYKSKFREAFIYSASDVYYSAITPSATGGQPASVYYMAKDGIPVSAGTAAVTFNIFMYTASIVIIALFAFLVNPSYFLHFDFIYKILIIAGIIVQSGILTFFFLLMKKPNLLKSLANATLKFLNKLKLVKNIDKKMESVDNVIKSYKASIDIISSNFSLSLAALFLNLLQRVSQMAIAVFIYLATGVENIGVVDIFVLQSFCLLGSNSVPIPGAAGVSEGLYLSAFSPFFNNQLLLNCMMATRGIAYYISFTLSGVLTFIHHVYITLRKNKKGKY